MTIRLRRREEWTVLEHRYVLSELRDELCGECGHPASHHSDRLYGSVVYKSVCEAGWRERCRCGQLVLSAEAGRRAEELLAARRVEKALTGG